MVTSVLDAGITEKVVRLGTRSADERIAQYTLDRLEKLANAPTLGRSMQRQYAIMKGLEEEMTNTMTSIRLPLLTWTKIEEFLDIHYPEHADLIREPPFWIAELAALIREEEERDGTFEEVKGKKQKQKQKQKQTVDKTVSRTLYGFWKDGVDLKFIQQQPANVRPQQGDPAAADAAEQSMLTNPRAFFDYLGFEGQTPPIPSKNRSLEDLQHFAGVWSMSLLERTRLANEWERRIRTLAYDSHLHHYTDLKERYKEACKDYDDMRDEVCSAFHFP